MTVDHELELEWLALQVIPRPVSHKVDGVAVELRSRVCLVDGGTLQDLCRICVACRLALWNKLLLAKSYDADFSIYSSMLSCAKPCN